MDAWNTLDRLMIISSDAHAGALPEHYRSYLPSQWHDQFDEWLAQLTMHWFDITDDRNWDPPARMRALDDEGVTGEVIFPNTLPPFYDILAHLSGVPRDRADFERRWAGLQAHNRWLVDFCSDAPDRARGLIQLLPNDVEAAVDEMEWASSRSVFGNVTWRKLARLRPVAPWGAGRLRP